MCVCVCVCVVCVRVCVYVCSMCVCVCARTRVCVCTHACVCACVRCVYVCVRICITLNLSVSQTSRPEISCEISAVDLQFRTALHWAAVLGMYTYHEVTYTHTHTYTHTYTHTRTHTHTHTHTHIHTHTYTQHTYTHTYTQHTHTHTHTHTHIHTHTTHTYTHTTHIHTHTVQYAVNTLCTMYAHCDIQDYQRSYSYYWTEELIVPVLMQLEPLHYTMQYDLLSLIMTFTITILPQVQKSNTVVCIHYHRYLLYSGNYGGVLI